MAEPEPGDDFENFPRGRLAMRLPRRRLWSALVTELQVSVGRSEGGRAYDLANLGAWSDAQLAGLIPEIARGCRIWAEAGWVWAQPAHARRPRQLFRLDSPALAAFNRFNGQTCLEANAADLAQETGWEAGRCFAYVRGLFLWLVLAGVCLPKG